MCSTPLRIGRRHDDPIRTSNPWFSSSNLEPRPLRREGTTRRRTYSASNFESITPLANQMIALNQSKGQPTLPQQHSTNLGPSVFGRNGHEAKNSIWSASNLRCQPRSYVRFVL